MQYYITKSEKNQLPFRFLPQREKQGKHGITVARTPVSGTGKIIPAEQSSGEDNCDPVRMKKAKKIFKT